MRRISLGHGLMQLGIRLRTASGYVGAGLLAMLVGGALVGALVRGGYPEPFGLLHRITPSVGLGRWSWEGLVIVVAALLAGRAIAMAVGAVGWSLFPPHHRDLLSRAIGGARRAPAGEAIGNPAPAARTPGAGPVAER